MLALANCVLRFAVFQRLRPSVSMCPVLQIMVPCFVQNYMRPKIVQQWNDSYLFLYTIGVVIYAGQKFMLIC